MYFPPTPHHPLDPQTPMDATTTSAATRRRHHHPLQEPTNGPPSTVQAISNRFSKLYANHKKLVASSMEPPLGVDLHPHPQPEPHFLAKTKSLPPFLNTLSTTLTKSNSQLERQSSNDLEVVNVRIKDELRNLSCEGFEVGKVAHLMSKSLESEKVKGFQKDEFKKSLSKNSSFEGFDVKNAAHLMSKSFESEKMKGFLQKDGFKKSSFVGFEVKKAAHMMSKSLEKGKMKGFQKDEFKKPLSKNSSFKGFDVKRESHSMSKSFESEKVKGFQNEIKKSSFEGCEVKRASHLMSKSLESEEMRGFQKDEIKKPLSKNSSFEGCEVKRASHLMSKSLESEKVKGFEQGFEVIRKPIGNNGGRRKSLCSSEVELSYFFSCSGVKVVAVDMPPSMQIHAVDCARKAHDSLEKFTSKTLALTLKKEFDGAYGPAWHCIVGTSFGSFVTHSVGGFIYFSMDHKLYILLFKTTVKAQQQ